MAILETSLLKVVNRDTDARLLQNLKDYTSMAFALLVQRQAIYIAAALLTAFYFNPWNALIFYCTIVICEIQDIILARRVARLEAHQHDAIHSCHIWILLNTVLSATAICLYAVSVAMKQGAGGHFTPLFFLFAAALFAAMNNHQLVKALAIRLTMYGFSFLFIVCIDIYIYRPSMDSDLWLQFFTIVFVMYFLIDCSIEFLNCTVRTWQIWKLFELNMSSQKRLYRKNAFCLNREP